jgi:toxin ParE1/3/4
MKPVIWSEKSISSIQKIYDYIFEESPQNADLVIDHLFELGEKLNLFPEKNPKEPLYNSDYIRFFPKWNFKIVYRIEQTRIYVLDVFSTHRNPKKIFL